MLTHSSRNGWKSGVYKEVGVKFKFHAFHISCEDMKLEQGSHTMEHGQWWLDEQKMEPRIILSDYLCVL